MTLPQDYRHRLCAPSPSNRRQSRAKCRWRWRQRQQVEAYSSRWSEWPFLERGEQTSNHASKHPSIDWQWIRSSWTRPNFRTHWKLSAVDTVEMDEDQKLGSQWVAYDTHCLDIHRRLAQGRSRHRWLTPLERQAPMHPLPVPMLKFPNRDRCCSNPVLPHRLSWRCPRPKCEETPAPCHLPPQTPHCSSRAIWPNWNSETEFADTSHSGWWTKTVNSLDAHKPRKINEATYNY